MDNTIETHEATGRILDILSIDFDIIMYPCIKLYNDKINGSESPVVLWNILQQSMEIDSHLSYDAKTLLLLGWLLKRAKSNNSEIIALNEHQEIVDDLKKMNEYSTDIYNLTNVDFHHDIFYRKDDQPLAKYFDKCDCSNWVGYLYKNNKLVSYTWYKAPNSEGFNPRLIDENDMDKFIIKSVGIDEDLKELASKTFHRVYLVKSPQWVPYKYIHLYNLLYCMVTDNEYSFMWK